MEPTIKLKDKKFKLFIPEKEIVAAINRIAEEIRKDVDKIDPLFVGILNGSFMFTAELMGKLNDYYEVTFASYSSYKGLRSSGSVAEIMPIQVDFRGRHLILLEDVVDSGITMHYLIPKLKSEGAADVKLATMLLKPEALQCDLKPDYVGLEIPNDFIVGFGLDYEGLGRSYRDIYTLTE